MTTKKYMKNVYGYQYLSVLPWTNMETQSEETHGVILHLILKTISLNFAYLILLEKYESYICSCSVTWPIVDATSVFSSRRRPNVCHDGVTKWKHFPHKWPVTRKMFPFGDVIMANVGPTSGGEYRSCVNDWPCYWTTTNIRFVFFPKGLNMQNSKILFSI